MAGKRRTNGEGSIYQLPNGRWRVLVTVQSGGKSVRVSRKVATRADARAVLDKLRSEYSSGLNVEGGRMPLSTWLAEWLRDTIKPNKAANTYESYRAAVSMHICGVNVPGNEKKRDFDLGKVRVDKITPQAVKRWLAELMEHEVGARTRENAFVVLQAALQTAVESNYLIRNPCEAVERPAYEPSEASPFELLETKHLLRMVGGHKHEALYRIAIETGMRQGELFGLLWDNVDLKAKQLHVRQQATEVGGKLVIGKPKTKRSIRTLDLTPASLDALIRLKAQQLKAGEAGNPIVFPNQDGGYLRKGSFNRWSWKPLLIQAELGHRGFHQMRHTAATLMLKAGIPINVVSETLGHSSATVTLKIYAHVLGSMRQSATAAMAQLLG